MAMLCQRRRKCDTHVLYAPPPEYGSMSVRRSKT